MTDRGERPAAAGARPGGEGGPSHRVRWLGHATALLELGGARFLTDPVLSWTVGLVWPRLVPPAEREAELVPLDGILLSHAHLDHLDAPTLRRLLRASREAGGGAGGEGAISPVVVAPGFADLVEGLGFRDVRTLRWGEATALPCGARVSAIPAAHFKGRGPWRPSTGYQGYVVEHAGATVMFAGDTGACRDYPDVGARFDIDVAILPIGAYSPPAFRPVHMAPEDALDALEQLRARTMVPIHHSTFKLSAETMRAPMRRLRRKARRRGLEQRVAMLAIGERHEFDSARPPAAAGEATA